MTLLGGWLRQLILIIFLAILADFLLPTKAMQKYVRMVMGLAVIAAMLQPMMPLFGGGFANSLADQATSEILGTTTSSQGGTPTYDVAGLKEKLQAEQTKTETALLEARLQALIAEACHCTVTAVSVETDNNGKVVSVTVNTPAKSNDTRQQIVQFVSKQLALTSSQVQVVDPQRGGDSSGF